MQTFKQNQLTIPFLSQLTGDCYDEMNVLDFVTYGIFEEGRRMEDQVTRSMIEGPLPQKEKDPKGFTLPCYINNVCFRKALADLGASVSIMPLTTFTNLVVDNMDGYRDQDMGDVIFREPFCKASCVKARRFDGLITIHNVEYRRITSIGYGVSSFLSNTTYSSHQINTAYPLSLDTAYRSSGTEANSKFSCMTRSSTNELFTPYKEPEREFRSSRRHFKTLSLDELRSPDFNLLSDQEYSEEEEEEAMAETMEQYMSKTRTDYGSGVARPKIDNKDQFELKGQFLKEL
ncbi:hypothetical protein Tco_0773195 [Tanacetum coccineum]|uniref:Uncharacterized protein n=1 Tax=Tanacetum coccineum TaxID=301880 RepID=A0ABQ4ZK22_9ASTR